MALGTALKEVFARFTTEVDDKPLKKADKSAGSLTKTLGTLGAAFAAYAGAGAVRSFVGGILESNTELVRMAASANTTVEAMQELQFAAHQTAGPAGAEAMFDAMATLADRAQDAAFAGGDAAESFDRMGVALHNQDGQLKSSDQLLTDFAAAYAAMPDQTEAAGLAMAVLGGSAEQLNGLFAQGAEGVNGLRREFRELGGGMSRDAIDKSRQTAQAMGRLGAVVDGVKSDLAASLLPAITTLVEWLQKGVKWFRDATKGVDFLRAALVVLGPVLTAIAIKGFMMMLNPVGLVIVGLIAMALVVEDLITAYNGGESAIGSFLQAHLGVDLVGLLDSWSEGFTKLSTYIVNMADTAGSSVMWLAGVFGEFVAGALDGLGELVQALEQLGPLGGIFGMAGNNEASSSIRGAASGLARGASANRGRINNLGGRINERRSIGDSFLEQESARRDASRRDQAAARTSANKREVFQTITQENNIHGSNLNEQQVDNIMRKNLAQLTRQLQVEADGAN